MLHCAEDSRGLSLCFRNSQSVCSDTAALHLPQCLRMEVGHHSHSGFSHSPASSKTITFRQLGPQVYGALPSGHAAAHGAQGRQCIYDSFPT